MGLFRKKHVKSDKIEEAIEPEQESPLSLEVFNENLQVIQERLNKIAAYKKKRDLKTPTHVHWKTIDLEEAWPTAKELYDVILRLMEELAEIFDVDPCELPPGATFKDALMHIDILIQRITLQLEQAGESEELPRKKMAEIDQQISLIQDAGNRLQNYVFNKFNFTPVLSKDLKDKKAN